MQSMTAFAQGRFTFENGTLFISLKSLNNRYLELSVRGNGFTPETEKLIRDIIKNRISRGKIEITMDVIPAADSRQWEIQLNEPLLIEALDRVSRFKKKFARRLSLSLDSFLRLPMIFRLDAASSLLNGPEPQWLKNSFATVLAQLLENRRQEGESILQDLLTCGNAIQLLVATIAERSRSVEKELLDEFRGRIEKLVNGTVADEKRILLEAAMLAEKSSIAEEVSRLQTHTRRLLELLTDDQIATKGKEIDFLSQELLRETHTISAKTNSLDIHQQIILIRREIEKIRQQAQNVE